MLREGTWPRACVCQSFHSKQKLCFPVNHLYLKVEKNLKLFLAAVWTCVKSEVAILSRGLLCTVTGSFQAEVTGRLAEALDGLVDRSLFD